MRHVLVILALVLMVAGLATAEPAVHHECNNHPQSGEHLNCQSGPPSSSQTECATTGENMGPTGNLDYQIMVITNEAGTGNVYAEFWFNNGTSSGTAWCDIGYASAGSIGVSASASPFSGTCRGTNNWTGQGFEVNVSSSGCTCAGSCGTGAVYQTSFGNSNC